MMLMSDTTYAYVHVSRRDVYWGADDDGNDMKEATFSNTRRQLTCATIDWELTDKPATSRRDGKRKRNKR
eukprot:scaffold82303_cov58-Cyclotella_meneghiniana.AAC.2